MSPQQQYRHACDLAKAAWQSLLDAVRGLWESHCTLMRDRPSYRTALRGGLVGLQPLLRLTPLTAAGWAIAVELHVAAFDTAQRATTGWQERWDDDEPRYRW